MADSVHVRGVGEPNHVGDDGAWADRELGRVDEAEALEFDLALPHRLQEVSKHENSEPLTRAAAISETERRIAGMVTHWQWRAVNNSIYRAESAGLQRSLPAVLNLERFWVERAARKT